tara:strand:+ start:557 stop:1465 length:909 start_codon:yes stop_codon:yes gene_type:complete
MKDNNLSEGFIKEINPIFILNAAEYFDALDNKIIKNIEISQPFVSINDKIIPFLNNIKALNIIDKNTVKKNKIEEDKIYSKNTKKYLLYLYYKNISPKPDWVKSAQNGWETFLDEFTDDIEKSRLYSLFNELDLLDKDSQENMVWWSDLKLFSINLNNEEDLLNKKIIGDKGESYSEKYELKRKCKPNVVSRWNENLGYDIESQESSNDNTIRYIEVKASEVGINKAEANISKNQTTKAGSYKNYYFHFWDISDEKEPKLAIVDGKKIADQAPKEIKAGKLKEWTYAFKEFRNEFFDPKITI